MPTPKQIRAARVYLDWSQDDLAERSGLAVSTIRNIEGGTNAPSGKSALGLEKAFGELIEFLPNGGIQPKQESITIYRGHEGFVNFMKDVHATCRDVGGDVYVSNVDETLFEKWLGDFLWPYVGLMNEIEKGNFRFKIITRQGDDYAPALYADYRWLPDEVYSPVPTYIYGNKLAIVVFEEEDVMVFVHDNQKIVDAFRKQFLFVWGNANELGQKG